MKPFDPHHAANQRRWDAASANWARGADSRGLWRRCPTEPSLVLSSTELRYLADVSGKRVCVLGSGDNQVVFALAGLGALVTSVDISSEQLNVAQRRAEELGLAIEFVQADVTDLSEIADGSFDVVYSGGHVALWVSDLAKFYAEAARIAANDGLLVVCEYHPFRRIWRESKTELMVKTRYFERGPFEHHYTDDILSRAEGPLTSYEHHWTVSDYLNALVNAGCRIERTEEFGENVASWEGAPMRGLPEFLLIIARKRTGF